MTVSENLDPRVIYAGPIEIGAALPITFPYINKEEVFCKLNDTILTYNVDYTITGQNMFLVTQAATAADKVTIYRATTVDQQGVFPQNSRFDSEKVGECFDKTCMIQQEFVAEINRTVRLSNTTEGFNSELPAPVARRALVVNEDATSFVMSDNDPDELADDVQTAVSTAQAASTQAAQAQATATSASTQAAQAQAGVASLSASKQDKLVSGTNIKTINNQSLLGSGNIDIQGGGSGANVDLSNLSETGEAKFEAKQDTLVSGTNIKTINNTSILGSGNIEIQGGNVPIATTETAGIVKPDGTTITVTADGTITSVGGSGGGANVDLSNLSATGQAKFNAKQDKFEAKAPISITMETTGAPHNYSISGDTAVPTYSNIRYGGYEQIYYISKYDPDDNTKIWMGIRNTQSPNRPESFNAMLDPHTSYIDIPVNFGELIAQADAQNEERQREYLAATGSGGSGSGGGLAVEGDINPPEPVTVSATARVSGMTDTGVGEFMVILGDNTGDDFIPHAIIYSDRATGYYSSAFATVLNGYEIKDNDDKGIYYEQVDRNGGANWDDGHSWSHDSWYPNEPSLYMYFSYNGTQSWIRVASDNGQNTSYSTFFTDTTAKAPVKNIIKSINCARFIFLHDISNSAKQPKASKVTYSATGWKLSDGVVSTREMKLNFDGTSLKRNSEGKLYADMSTKQDNLVSGTNIKTINDQSILGSGNLEIGEGTLTPASPLNIQEVTVSPTNLITVSGNRASITGSTGHLQMESSIMRLLGNPAASTTNPTKLVDCLSGCSGIFVPVAPLDTTTSGSISIKIGDIQSNGSPYTGYLNSLFFVLFGKNTGSDFEVKFGAATYALHAFPQAAVITDPTGRTRVEFPGTVGGSSRDENTTHADNYASFGAKITYAPGSNVRLEWQEWQLNGTLHSKYVNLPTSVYSLLSEINEIRVYASDSTTYRDTTVSMDTTKTIRNNGDWSLANASSRPINTISLKYDDNTIKVNSSGKLYANVSAIPGATQITEMSTADLLPAWYVVYNNGWCVQGGKDTGTIGNYNTKTVNLIKTYADTNFSVQVTKNNKDYMIGAWPSTTSSFQWGGRYFDDDLGGQTTSTTVCWQTAGFLPEE